MDKINIQNFSMGVGLAYLKVRQSFFRIELYAPSDWECAKGFAKGLGKGALGGVMTGFVFGGPEGALAGGIFRSIGEGVKGLGEHCGDKTEFQINLTKLLGTEF